jgi:DNA-binding LacI/PurR family transcriptional regulator
MGVLAAADRAARQVPGELSVIGFDDIESAKLLGLSTVRQPLEDSGTEAARRLCALLRGEPIGPQRQQLPLEVVHRSSTARLRRTRPPAGDAHTGKAARVPEVSAAGT